MGECFLRFGGLTLARFPQTAEENEESRANGSLVERSGLRASERLATRVNGSENASTHAAA
jgi:hypothetical protein